MSERYPTPTSANYGSNSPLAKAASPLTRETFAYDPLGNRTSTSSVGGVPSPRVTSYTANALNQYTQVAGVAFTYDANGNLTHDGKQTYRYDAQNRLLSVEPVAPTTGAIRAEFAYDARNRAVARTYYTLSKAGAWVLNQDDSRALTYDTSWNLLAERTRNGVQAGEYIHGQRTDEVLVTNLKSKQVYPLADGLGSVVALANDNGKVVERFRYSAYGQPTSLSATYQAIDSSVSGYKLLFTGREWLGAIGLNEHRNRYYIAISGRWLSRDPAKFLGGKNLYAYVDNSSINLCDPSGLGPCSAEEAAMRAANSNVRDRLRAYGSELADVAFAAGTTIGALSGTIVAARTGNIVVALASGGTSVLAGLNVWYQSIQADWSKEQLDESLRVLDSAELAFLACVDRVCHR